MKDFLEARRYPADVTKIGAHELREFILHLQQVRAFEHHPFTKPQTKGLSGHAINCYLRTIRAFWSWLVREDIIMSSPFSRVKIPKPPRKEPKPKKERSPKAGKKGKKAKAEKKDKAGKAKG